MFGLSPCHKGRKKIINELKDKKKKKKKKDFAIFLWLS